MTDDNFNKALTAEGDAPMGRPPEGKPKDAQGHAIEGGGHRLVYNPGVRGGRWYRDKNGFVQYGTLFPRGAPTGEQRYVLTTAAPKPATRPSGKPQLGVPPGSRAPYGIRGVLGLSHLTNFGLANISEIANLMTPEVRRELHLGNTKEDLKQLINTHSLPSGAMVLAGLMASKVGVPVEHLADLSETALVAERLGVQHEDVIGRMFDEHYRNPDGTFQDGYDEATREALIESVFKSYSDLSDDTDFQTAVAQAVDVNLGRQFIFDQQLQLLNNYKPQLAKIFDPSAPAEVSFVRFLAVAKELGLIGIPRSIEEVPNKIGSDGKAIPHSEQQNSVGKIHVNTLGIEWLTRHLTNLAGTDQANPTLAEMLPILTRFAAWQEAQRLNSPSDAAVAWFLNPDGSVKHDFVSKLKPGSDQYAALQADPEGFWKAPPWERGGYNEMLQDKGLEVALITNLHAQGDPSVQDPAVVRSYFQHVNSQGAMFAQMINDFNTGNLGSYGYHLSEAVASRRLTLQEALDDEGVTTALQRLVNHKNHVAASVEARTVPVDYALSLVPQHMRDHWEASGFKPLPLQLRAAHFHVVANKSICALDVGTGKTVVAAIVGERMLEKVGLTCHWVPKNGIDQYPEELERFIGPKFSYARIATSDVPGRGQTYDEAVAELEAILDGKSDAKHLIISHSWWSGGRELTDLKRTAGLDIYDPETNAIIKNPAYTKEQYIAELDKLIPQLRYVQLLKQIQEKIGIAHIIDEVHSPGAGLRNPDNIAARVHNYLMQGNQFELGMTATPAAVSPTDMAEIVHAVAPGMVSPEMKDLLGETASTETYPEYDAYGLPTGKMLRRYSNLPPFLKAAASLKPVLYQKFFHDPDVRAELEAAGRKPPSVRVSSVNIPTHPITQHYLELADEGHDDYVRLEEARIRNNRRVNEYRNRLARYNPMYADSTQFPDEDLWHIRKVTVLEKDADGNVVLDAAGNPGTYEIPVAEDYRLKPPKKDTPLRWEDVKDHPQKAALYKYNLGKKIRLDPQLVYGSLLPEEHKGTGLSKVDACIDALKDHLNNPATSHGCAVVTLESVKAMRILRERMREVGINSAVTVEFRGDGDSVVMDRRVATDRDAAARLINKGHLKVALMSTKLAVGLNVQHATRMIMVEEPGTIHHMEQTQGRINRFNSPGIAEIVILRLNTPADFRALQRRQERAMSVTPILQHDEATSTMNVREAVEYHMQEAMRRLALPDPLSPSFEDEMNPIPHEQALRLYMERYGLAGLPFDYSRFRRNVEERSATQRVPAAGTVWSERYARIGLNPIKQARRANEYIYEKSPKEPEDTARYERRKAELDRDQDLWLASKLAFDQSSISVPNGKPVYVPNAFPFTMSRTVVNPWTTYASQYERDDNRLKILNNVKLLDNPEAIPARSDLPGKSDVFIHQAMWEAITKHDVKDVGELVDLHIRKVAEAAGLWDDTFRLTMYVKLTNMLHEWAKVGIVNWAGTPPPVMPTSAPSLGEVQEIKAPPPPPDLPYDEIVLRFIADAARSSPETLRTLQAMPEVQGALEHLGLEHKPPEMTVLAPAALDPSAPPPQFTPTRIWNGSTQVMVLPDTLINLWDNVKRYLASGRHIGTVEEAHEALTGGLPFDPESAHATNTIMYEFEKRGLVQSSYVDRPPAYKVTPVGSRVIPTFEPLVAEDGTELVSGPELEDYWERLAEFLFSNGHLKSHHDLVDVLDLPYEKMGMSQHILNEFVRQRLLQLERR